jgi:micrococcal nuclease
MEVEYVYKCDLVKVIDGDTVRLNVDLGFNMSFMSNFRLSDIDAPEIRGEERPLGLESKNFLIEFLKDKELAIRARKYTGKYGRYIVELYANGELANDTLVKEGHAIRRIY